MSVDHIFVTALLTLSVLSVWLTLWVKLVAVIALAGAALTFHLIRINKLKNQKAEIQRQLNERSELLTYSLERERKARENADQANRTKSLLLSRINHEIRTPLNGVLGMASLMTETKLTSEQQDYNDTIRESGESLLRVVNEILLNDILEFSKVDGVKMELEQKDFDLRACIEEVLDVFSGKAAKAGLELMCQVDHNVPPQIIGDDMRLRQVLTNLIENAISYTVYGEILVKVQMLQPPENNVLKIGFEVCDTGVGIAADKLKILTADLNNPNVTPNKERGAGVGLVICKKLVEWMGGSVTVESQLDKGTCFRFNIRTAASLQSLRNSINQDIADIEGKKILIVDDNVTYANILKSQLEQWKLVPIVANSGKQALELLAQKSGIDLLLTDRQMPEVDGLALAQSTRKQFPELPIILLTPSGDHTGKQHPELFNSYLNKPAKLHLLSKHIANGLKPQSASVEELTAKPKLSEEFAKRYPLRIVIAEDNLTNQKLAKKILGKLGYTPDVAQHGKELLEIVSLKNYDLVLMDVQMPEMDGLEASRMIRLCLSVQPVIIAMTANTMQGDRDECLRAGMDDYISKPINIDELVNILEKWACHIKEKK